MISFWELSFLLIPNKFSRNCLLSSKVAEEDRQVDSVTTQFHQPCFLVLEFLLKIWIVIGQFFYPFVMCLWFLIKSLTHWRGQDTVMNYSASIATSKHNNSSEAACLHKYPGDLCHELEVKHRAEINLQGHFAEDNDSSKFFANNVLSSKWC